ncbi:probable N-acetylglucosaminyl-phosphatidylinositol de-N-acetylase isoform X1 [Neltuma alba]|uniref:probable N-acetylglucosaminyl-phosphatidylinositol de-N-acetylase isoform X1 n=1 Tax=Neltuma alba TaxID=207710 RepID=UPI0010A45EF7|nr:probable N-acetylglucosaminyl-phosphatidylinositol de-N-acetylase isoform X1 [Prosopis alba]XP_028780597.1 probable N-acetylglucosaminyl-phosphatidylinositol de-N-acetylase isoform X1 [Prosopis alba]
MAWILITGCLLSVWVISLCKVLLLAHMCKRNSFKKNGKALRKRNVLIVIAHPDDESMFFTPTINYLISRGHYIYILCLSIGDADNRGRIRKRELFQACATLKVPMQQVKVVDHPDLQDGFGKVWNHKLVANLVKEEIGKYNIDMIITFDNYGVSGHCNHRDVYYGVCELLYDIPHREIEAWELVSTNILRKYIGPIDVWLSVFVAMLHSNETIQFLVNEHPCRSFLAMAQHSSQWVWFRKCFVAMSSYTYMNTLRKIK